MPPKSKSDFIHPVKEPEHSPALEDPTSDRHIKEPSLSEEDQDVPLPDRERDVESDRSGGMIGEG